MNRPTPDTAPITATGAHVVVGVDGSDAALAAVGWAAHEAARRQLGLRLVSCYSVPFYGEPGMLGTYAVESQIDAIKDEHHGYVRVAVQRALESVPGLVIDSIITLGSPAITLPRSTEHGGVLVVGSAGRTGRLADAIGSVATSAIHHARTPVIVVPANSSRKGNSMKKIVVGTDGSEAALEALQWAYEEARMAHAELTVLHGWEYPYPDSTGSASDMRQRMEHDATAQLEDSVAKVVRQAKVDGVTVHTKLVESVPAKALIDESADADLVVVGSRGRGGFASMLLGSVSRAVVQHSACPVAVIRHSSH